MKSFDISTELYREYDFDGRVYRIDNPQLLTVGKGWTTHRILDLDNVEHVVPSPGFQGCVLRIAWKYTDNGKARYPVDPYPYLSPDQDANLYNYIKSVGKGYTLDPHKTTF